MYTFTGIYRYGPDDTTLISSGNNRNIPALNFNEAALMVFNLQKASAKAME